MLIFWYYYYGDSMRFSNIKTFFTKKDKQILYFLTVIISSLIIIKCFKLHYASDTYRALCLGLDVYGKYAILALGRIFSWIYFELIVDLNFNTICIIKTSLSIIIASFCILVTYSKFITYFKKNIKNIIIIYLLSFICIINPFSIELFYYIESPIMWLSILTSILASIFFISKYKHKYILSILLLLFTIFSYQPNINVFICYSLFLILFEQYNIKKFFKMTVLCGIEYGFVAFINMIFIFYVLNPIFNVSKYKYATHFTLDGFLKITKFMLKHLFINSYPKYLYLIIYIILVLSIIFILYHKKKLIKNLFCYLSVLFLIVIFSLLPTLSFDVNNLYFGTRFFIAIVMSFLLSIIYIYNYLFTNKKNQNIFLFFVLSLFIFNSFYCFNLLNNQFKINKIDSNQLTTINKVLSSYEDYNKVSPNNIFITLTFSNDKIINYKIDNEEIKINYNISFFQNAISNNVFILDALNYYNGKNRNYPTIKFAYSYDTKCEDIFKHNIFEYDNDLYFCFDQ